MFVWLGIPEHDYPNATPVRSRKTKKRGPDDFIIKQIKTEEGNVIEKKIKVYTQRFELIS